MSPREREVLGVAEELQEQLEQRGLLDQITLILETQGLAAAQLALLELIAAEEEILGQTYIAKLRRRIGTPTTVCEFSRSFLFTKNLRQKLFEPADY